MSDISHEIINKVKSESTRTPPYCPAHCLLPVLDALTDARAIEADADPAGVSLAGPEEPPSAARKGGIWPTTGAYSCPGGCDANVPFLPPREGVRNNMRARGRGERTDQHQVLKQSLQRALLSLPPRATARSARAQARQVDQLPALVRLRERVRSPLAMTSRASSISYESCEV